MVYILPDGIFCIFTFSPTAHLGPIEGLVAFVFGSLGILIPTPGGMGSFHYLMGEALSMYGISGADAFSFANIVFFNQYISAHSIWIIGTYHITSGKQRLIMSLIKEKIYQSHQHIKDQIALWKASGKKLFLQTDVLI